MVYTLWKTLPVEKEKIKNIPQEILQKWLIKNDFIIIGNFPLIYSKIYENKIILNFYFSFYSLPNCYCDRWCLVNKKNNATIPYNLYEKTLEQVLNYIKLIIKDY